MSHENIGIELRQVSPEWTVPLGKFFQHLIAAGDQRSFHPHPFTTEEAARICTLAGRDLYYVMAEGRRVLGYGMLRGWDQGYDVPSLGIAIHPQARGRGLGVALMTMLHLAAQCRGAPRVRLKVYESNSRAVRMYEKLGYRFDSREGEQLVGILELGSVAPLPAACA